MKKLLRESVRSLVVALNPKSLVTDGGLVFVSARVADFANRRARPAKAQPEAERTKSAEPAVETAKDPFEDTEAAPTPPPTDAFIAEFVRLAGSTRSWSSYASAESK